MFVEPYLYKYQVLICGVANFPKFLPLGWHLSPFFEPCVQYFSWVHVSVKYMYLYNIEPWGSFLYVCHQDCSADTSQYDSSWVMCHVCHPNTRSNTCQCSCVVSRPQWQFDIQVSAVWTPDSAVMMEPVLTEYVGLDSWPRHTKDVKTGRFALLSLALMS